jgi:fructosamine-3-kinase
MQGALARALKTLILNKMGLDVDVMGNRVAGGGCINEAMIVELSNGSKIFLKTNDRPLPGMFEAEEAGLQALASADMMRVPKALGTGGGADGVPPFIAMEYIEPGKPEPRFAESFGRDFARLHQRTSAEAFGFAHDNYLGSTPQRNTWTSDWVEFWREHRLGFQLRLARRKGLVDSQMENLANKLLARLDELIGGPAEGPCLLHGDLWGGNYLVDRKGNAVLIDPATYFGRREADLAMTMLFGGFDGAFYAAYREYWPLAAGAADRLEIYKLYHLLNHLNLFGSGYRAGCMSILRRFA